MTDQEILDLIKKSSSIDEDEKQYWIDILPIISDSHKDKLYRILLNEKVKLEKLNKKILVNYSEMENNKVIKELISMFWEKEVLAILLLVLDLYSRTFEQLEIMHSLAKSNNIKSIIKNIMDLKIKSMK